MVSAAQIVPLQSLGLSRIKDHFVDFYCLQMTDFSSRLPTQMSFVSVRAEINSSQSAMFSVAQ